MSKRYLYLQYWLIAVVLCTLFSLAGFPAAPVFAQGTPTVAYIAVNKTLILGDDAGAEPGSQAITIPTLAATLAGQGFTDVLVDQGNGVWLLNASILIRTTARLEVTGATLSELRLESSPAHFVVITAQRRAHLLLDGIKLTSWDATANAPDTYIEDGRSYLQALDGGKLEILHNSDVGYLGYGTSATGGIAWRKRLNPLDPTTSSSGRVEDSQIHNNHFGLYASDAYSMTIAGNQVYSNANTGILVQDTAQAFVVANNDVFQNGLHGIVFSRGPVNNNIRDNKVHDNIQHGILLERAANNNTVQNNETYGNLDGIALAQSSDNLVANNYTHNNARGLRVSATIDTLATNNQLISNLTSNNSEHGIYLYSNADRNTLRGNTVEGNADNGIYIKSGGNLVESNLIRNGVTGLAITGGEIALASEVEPGSTIPALPPLDPPGNNNIIISSTITANSEVGIRISGGSNNRIGADPSAVALGGTNLIEANGKEGIYISMATGGAASTDNLVFGNTIRSNGRSGISVKDPSSVRNRISQNRITANGGSAIKLDAGAQQNTQPPVITQVLADGEVYGITLPNATVEVYTDPADEGETVVGATTADANGFWRLPASGQNPKQITALTIDTTGNTSVLSERSGATISPFFTVGIDDRNQPLIQVSDGPATITLAALKTGLGTMNQNLLVEMPNGVWRLNANLLVGTGVTLTLSSGSGVSELQLRSQSSVSSTGAIDNGSFVYLRTQDGVLDLDGVKIYAWDEAANTYDQDLSNGRAYVAARYAAVLNIRNSELSYLGAVGGESSGVAWRDLNDPANPGALRTRVSGQVLNSKFHHNYDGAYTLQAGNMVFQGNEFFANLRFGFAARDFSHHFVVENSVAYNNGSHGFFISRGSNNIVLRNNKSYNNSDPGSSQAHGFALDPGTLNATTAEAPSVDNLLENNEAYGNEGSGLRLLGSNNNQLRNNRAYQNQGGGISIERNSSSNLVVNNTLTANHSHGLVVRGAADGNIMTSNVISNNVGNGLYLRSSNNTVNGNTVQGNQLAGIALTPDTDTTATLQNNQLVSNTISSNTKSGIDLRGAASTQVKLNQITNNGEHGLYLTDGANQSAVVQNRVQANRGYGIQMSGVEVFGNTWSENQIYANEQGGIGFANGVNPNLLAPRSLSAEACQLSGLTRAGSSIEIFLDEGSQGQYFQGQVSADANGAFTFEFSGQWLADQITAIATDAQGNSSTFSEALAIPVNFGCGFFYLPLIAR